MLIADCYLKKIKKTIAFHTYLSLYFNKFHIEY